MIRFPGDAYREVDFRNGGIEKIPHTACWQIDGLMHLARHEGLELVAANPREGRQMRQGFKYHPEDPSIEVVLEQAWPEVRWCLAVAVGMHFTRGIYLDESTGLYINRERWKEQAMIWATNFLSSHLRDLRHHALPDFSARGKHLESCGGPPPKGAAPKTKTFRPNRSPERCRSTRGDGKPCRGHRRPGTPFCQHHQDEGAKLSTLGDIVSNLRGGGHLEG